MLVPNKINSIVVFVFPIFLSVFLSGIFNRSHGVVNDNLGKVQSVVVSDLVSLQNLFQQNNYMWPPVEVDQVPKIHLKRIPVDIKDLGVIERKKFFLKIMLPVVLSENERLLLIRRKILAWQANGVPEKTTSEFRELVDLLQLYKIKFEKVDRMSFEALLTKVDSLPPSLILAQAAIESGWGTSRFALQANNFFGVWTYDAENGILPKNRQVGRRHLVRKFLSIQASVRNYLYTINVGKVYQKLRKIRKKFRLLGRGITGIELSDGLIHYSEKGKVYVDLIRGLIISNKLGDMDRLAEKSFKLFY